MDEPQDQAPVFESAQAPEAMRPAEFQPLAGQAQAPSQAGPERLGQLMKVDVEAQVCLGSALMKLNQVLELHEGSVVTLEREVGQNVDLLVNNQVFAQGQIVVVGDRYGLRILSLASA